MKKDLAAIISSAKVENSIANASIQRILKNFAKLTPATRQAMVPALQELQDLKQDKSEASNLSFQLMRGLQAIKPEGEAAVGVVLFVLAFLGAILNLPSFLILEGESIYLKIIWRYLILLILLIPKFLFDLAANVNRLGEIFWSNLLSIFWLSILNTAYVYTVYFSARHTFVAHTILLCSIGTTFGTTWKILRKQQFTSLEYIGIGINVFGAYLCCCEGAPIDRRDILIGDYAALFASAIYAMYSNISGAVLKEEKCPASVYLVIMSIYVIMLSLFLAAIFGEDIEILSVDPAKGLFGMFTTKANILYGFFGLGVMAGFVYHYFTVQSKKYVSTMFVNVCFNFTPFISQVTAYLLQAQPGFPGVFTTYGGACLFVGCTMLAMTYQDQKELAHVPTVGEIDDVEMENEPKGIMQMPIDPEYGKIEETKREQI